MSRKAVGYLIFEAVADRFDTVTSERTEEYGRNSPASRARARQSVRAQFSGFEQTRQIFSHMEANFRVITEGAHVADMAPHLKNFLLAELKNFGSSDDDLEEPHSGSSAIGNSRFGRSDPHLDLCPDILAQ
ncbi:MAG: hypothetical protein IPK68_22330 [Bdellovibrionales bacterium]|nr:hypothetical protein [Bdellovibrionales bacterium]